MFVLISYTSAQLFSLFPHLAEKGASKDPCSPIYCGRSVTSEPEVKGVADFIESVPGRFKAYVDFHGYLQVWLSPWGHSRGFPRRYIVQVIIDRVSHKREVVVLGAKSFPRDYESVEMKES